MRFESKRGPKRKKNTFCKLKSKFFTVPGLLQGSESCGCSQGPSSLSSSGFADARHPRFPVQGHILSVGGDALRRAFPSRGRKNRQLLISIWRATHIHVARLFQWRRQVTTPFHNLPTANTQTRKCLWLQTQAHTRWFINPILSHTNLHNNTRQSVWSISSCSGKHVSWK
jgi:hypothetical protein